MGVITSGIIGGVSEIIGVTKEKYKPSWRSQLCWLCNAKKMYILGKLTLAEEQFYNADLNNDGRVDSIDYALLKAYLLWIIKVIINVIGNINQKDFEKLESWNPFDFKLLKLWKNQIINPDKM